MFSCQCYEKWVSVRQRNIKLLLESATYIATTETVTCILQQKQLHISNRDSNLDKYNKNCHRIFYAETVTWISAAETSN